MIPHSINVKRRTKEVIVHAPQACMHSTQMEL